MKNKLHWNYVLRHCLSTLLLAPSVAQGLLYLIRENAYQVVGLVEVYPITLLVSVVFSFPTYLIYGVADYYLKKRSVPNKTIKWILNSIALVGIILTFSFLFRLPQVEIMIGYALTSLFFGVIYRLK
ncbi:hypothetical protein [Myroides sp. DW712]|uniref:hypothetical protein n=1 Tax=Myroides sp. DW712 TaxID=3389800 RepID=UPI0039792536